MSEEQLAAIKARAEAATAVTDTGTYGDTLWSKAGVIGEVYGEEDAAFFASARADVLSLVAEVEELRRVLRHIHEATDDGAISFLALTALGESAFR